LAWIQLDGADRLNAIGTQTYTDLAAVIPAPTAAPWTAAMTGTSISRHIETAF
jgi:hypothetical protein